MELNYMDRHGAYIQRIQPAEINYPGSHKQRWYFFWPESKCIKKPKMQDQPIQRDEQRTDSIHVQTVEEPKQTRNSMDQTSEILIVPETRSEVIQTTRSVYTPSVYSIKEEPSVWSTRTVSVESMISVEDPKLCPKCHRGRFVLQTTAAGYVSILLFFPVGVYAYLTKQCCAVERCSYCRHINEHPRKKDEPKK